MLRLENFNIFENFSHFCLKWLKFQKKDENLQNKLTYFNNVERSGDESYNLVFNSPNVWLQIWNQAISTVFEQEVLDVENCWNLKIFIIF